MGKYNTAGSIRGKDKCPKCRGKFTGAPLRCPACLTTPHRYYIDFPWLGKRIKLYSGSDGRALDSWERAYRLLTTMRAKVDAGTFDPREFVGADKAPLRFDNYARAWAERQADRHAWGEVSRGYYLEARRRVENYLIPALGRLSIRNIHEGVLADLRGQLPMNLKPSTIKEIFNTLRAIFTDAYTRRDIGRIPAMPRIKTPRRVVRWLSPEAQERVLAATPNLVYQTFFLFLMRQGCRPGEAMALLWRDVDLDTGWVVIRAAMDRGERREYTKTKVERRLKLHPEALEALQGLPARFAKGYVFVLRDGKPLTSQGAYQAWRQAVRRAGVPHCSLYEGTKHSLASQAINNGVPLEIIAAALGHVNPQSATYYAKVKGQPIDKLW